MDDPVDELALAIGTGLDAGHNPTTIAHNLIAAGWQKPAPRARLHPIGALGLCALAAGVVAAVFADWRWAVAGIAALVVCATIGAALDHRA